jgi:hypothetical protein
LSLQQGEATLRAVFFNMPAHWETALLVSYFVLCFLAYIGVRLVAPWMACRIFR